MRIIKASEFKAKCLKIMDEVAATRDPVVITKNGVAVAKLVPVNQTPKTLFGALASEVRRLNSARVSDALSPSGPVRL